MPQQGCSTQRRRGYLLPQLGQWHRIYSTSVVWVVENPQGCSATPLFFSIPAMWTRKNNSLRKLPWAQAIRCSSLTSHQPSSSTDQWCQGWFFLINMYTSCRRNPTRSCLSIWPMDPFTDGVPGLYFANFFFFFFNFYRNTVDLQYCVSFRCTMKWSSFMYKWYIFFFMFSSILCYYWRRKWQPTPVFLPGKSYRQRSLAGDSPQGHKNQTELSD